LGLLLIVGFGGGVIFWGGFNWALEVSNTETFCISCHEMGDTVFVELKKTIHYQNRSGVRATCPDCHVPKEWGHKLVRKVRATANELPKHFLGTMDTPEKFEEKRMELAQRVWATMKATDSRECRNCHENVWMDLTKQWGGAQRNHEIGIEKGLTCIDCHQGIAHKLPEGFERPHY
jgi:cytochrome c-type protein NapC